jgi:hypothetical protein
MYIFGLLIGPSFFVMFHISWRESKVLKKNFQTLSTLGKSCTLFNNCTVILKVDMLVSRNGDFILFSHLQNYDHNYCY